MLRKGDMAPEAIGRTDEGTPVSIADIKGRALAVFLTGEGSCEECRELFGHLEEAVGEFHDLECSPVVVSAADEDALAASRKLDDLSFMIISDFSREIHGACGVRLDGGEVSVILVDEDSRIVASLQTSHPRELVRSALAMARRLTRLR